MLLRGVLRGCETPYRLAMQWRNRRYDLGRYPTQQAGVPVVSVGNLTLGGTGKTPLVEWITRYLGQQHKRAAIVSRGYGAGQGGGNDEALELALALPQVPHLQNADRVAATRQAVSEHHAELVVLDDGFQHRRLGRDLDIVLLDATEPFGYEHVFPRGTLREPLEGLSRADMVVLSRADMLASSERDAIRQRVCQYAPRAAWCEVQHSPQQLINAGGDSLALPELADQRVAAFCGIGNPAGFRHTLVNLDANVITWREFADHHRFTAADQRSLSQWAADADLVICTRKDLVKLNCHSLEEVPLWALSVELEFLTGEEQLKEHLDTLV